MRSFTPVKNQHVMKTQAISTHVLPERRAVAKIPFDAESDLSTSSGWKAGGLGPNRIPQEKIKATMGATTIHCMVASQLDVWT